MPPSGKRPQVETAAKLLDQKGRTLEACVVLLPASLPRGEREIAKNALCEASAILRDAGERVRNPLPDLEDD